MDYGPEFVALVLRGLCHRYSINPTYIDLGKPWQVGFAESFHSCLRDELLDGEIFLPVQDAQMRLSLWRCYWNKERLHSSLRACPLPRLQPAGLRDQQTARG